MTNQYESLPPIIDAKQAAKVLHCSPRSVQRLCNDGKLAFCRIGRTLPRQHGLPAQVRGLCARPPRGGVGQWR